MTGSVVVTSRCETATERLGHALGRLLRPGMVVALEGDLGAGKTVLSRGVARGLGITEAVTSPTFTIVQEYARPAGGYLFHLDMYRISDDEAALAFGIEEYLFAPDGIALVEWPERIAGLLSMPVRRDAALLWRLRLEHAAQGSRRIHLPAPAEKKLRIALGTDEELDFGKYHEPNAG